MAVHPRAIVPHDRLRHEGCRLAIGVGDVVDDIFVDLHVVRHPHQAGEFHAELVLGGGDLVMMLLHHDAHFSHHRQHLRAHVLGRIHRVDREIPALGSHPVALVAHLIFGAAIGRQLHRIDAEAGVVGLACEADVVEDEEFRLRADIDRLADLRLLEEGLGLLRRHPRIAVIGLAGAGIEDVAEQHRGGLCIERIGMDANPDRASASCPTR